MKKLFATGVLWVLLLVAIGQKQANHWFFGDSVAMEFRPGGVVVNSQSSMYAPEGCATASDGEGNLLFYSNGQVVWNRRHEVMTGGESLSGEPEVTQPVLCIARPGDQQRYWYLFLNSPYNHRKLSYAVIDMEMAGGLGAVVQTADLMNGPSERMSAVNHCNGRDVWLIAHRQADNQFYSFLVRPEGIVAQPVVSDVDLPYDMNGSGNLKAAPSGRYLAMGMRSGSVVLALMHFNNQTGSVTDPLLISAGGLSYCYGIAFSHDSRRLYAGFGGEQYRIMQFDLTVEPWVEVPSTAYRVSLGNNYGFQEAPDGRIYVAQVNGSWLGCILRPGELGARCDYVPNHLYVGDTKCRMGLPSFNQSLFFKPVLETKLVCEEHSLVLRLPVDLLYDSIVWYPDFDLEPAWSITTFIDTVAVAYHQTGSYRTGAVLWHCGTTDTAYGSVHVALQPDIDLGTDTVLFEGQSIQLAVSGIDSCLWHDGSREWIRWVTMPGKYIVTAWNGVCSKTDSLVISNRKVPVFMPNVFTPNNNGFNDFWLPVVPFTTTYRVVVYDRFGARVAEIVPGSEGWDGTAAGKPCAEGIYVWVLDRPPDAPVYGSVMVIR